MVVLDDFDEVRPPPFTSMLLHASMESERLTPNVWHDPVKKITLRGLNDDVEAIEGCEVDVIARLSSRVIEADPDFLVVKNCEETFSYIFERAKLLGINLQLGREPTRNHSPRDTS
ncbi:MAG: DNA-directed polymerase [Thermoproteota archaeon]|nr:DNA-directed polymerase [Thermoproteota archaeon]